MISNKTLGVGALAFTAFLGGAHFANHSDAAAPMFHGTVYTVTATNARVNHEVMETPIVWVDGVPAEPVDSFTWDGFGSDWLLDAQASLRVNTTTNSGRIRASWSDRYGRWTYEQTIFAHPHHNAGLKIGPGATETYSLIKEAITTNVYMHGDTGSGPPGLPVVFAYLSTWGLAKVTLNGQPFLNPFDGPSTFGMWDGHTMTTVGARELDGTVRNSSGGIYHMSKPADGATDWKDLEFHLNFHDEIDPLTTNIPPLFQFVYHLTFEDVELSIQHAE